MIRGCIMPSSIPNIIYGLKRGFAVRGARMRSAAGAFLLLLVAACAGSRGGPIPYNVPNFGQPDSDSAQTVEADYRLAPMDTVRISVFQVPDLTGDFDVDLMGNISMPLVGTMKAADLTPAQLDDQITRKLAEKYLQNPDVAVSLKASTRRNVTVDGAVGSPGMYPVNGPTTLLQAIAMAKGPSADANPKRVAIFRQIQGKRMAAAFDLTAIRKGKMQDPPVYRGDIIVVDGSSVKQMQSQLLQTIPILGLFNPLLGGL
jgi:polysaccharide biosynthesis/export protein